jgi:hypothetical protein
MEDPNRYWDAVKKFWAGEDVWDVNPTDTPEFSSVSKQSLRSRL